MLKSISLKVAQLALIVGCLTLGYATTASAEVNMKLLNSVVKSCQDHPPKDGWTIVNGARYNTSPENCVRERYKYTLFMSKYPGLKKIGDLRQGFPSSLVIYPLAGRAAYSSFFSPQSFLDCMVTKDTNSNKCSHLGTVLINHNYSMEMVCSSCFEAYLSAGSNWPQSMTKDIINWFYELDKPSRKLVVDSLSNPDFMRGADNESVEALRLYLKIKEKVERETQERKRQELLN